MTRPVFIPAREGVSNDLARFYPCPGGGGGSRICNCPTQFLA